MQKLHGPTTLVSIVSRSFGFYLLASRKKALLALKANCPDYRLFYLTSMLHHFSLFYLFCSLFYILWRVYRSPKRVLVLYGFQLSFSSHQRQGCYLYIPIVRQIVEHLSCEIIDPCIN